MPIQTGHWRLVRYFPARYHQQLHDHARTWQHAGGTTLISEGADEPSTGSLLPAGFIKGHHKEKSWGSSPNSLKRLLSPSQVVRSHSSRLWTSDPASDLYVKEASARYMVMENRDEYLAENFFWVPKADLGL